MRLICRVAFVLTTVLTPLTQAAIPVADDSYTEHDFRKAMLAFNRRVTVEAYEQSGKRDPKWDAAAKAFLEGWSIRFANYAAEPIYRLEGEPPYQKLKELEEAAINAGCDDPLVHYCKVCRLMEDGRLASEIMPLVEQIAAQLNAHDDEPSWRGMWAQNRVYQLMDPKDAAPRANEWERFKDLAINLITKWKYQDVDARIIYTQIWETLEADGPDRQQAFVKALRAKPGGDEWLREMIFGSADVKAAWHFRGGGWANTVTDGGWAGFNRHLAQARDHLARAYQLQPKFPEAADEMIAVAMGAGRELNENERAWFDKAVAAQFDYAPAYSSYLWASRPRWGGTVGQMYDFGVECAQTKRYDTRVPGFLMRTLHDIADDMGGTQFWRQPGVYEQVAELYEGLAAQATKVNRPGVDADWLRTERAGFAWRVQRYDEARQLLDALGDRMQENAYLRFGAMGRLAASHAYAMRPGLSETINEAERQASLNQVEDAIKSYQGAASKLEPNDKAAFYLKSRLRQLKWQKQYDAGEWVDLQPTKDLAGWCPQAGTWEVDEQGGVVGTFVARQLLWMPCQGQFIRGNYVIEGNVELLGEQSCSGGVGMTYNSLERIYGLFLQRDAAHAKTSLRRDFWPSATDEITLAPKNKFSFSFAAGRASASVNDKDVFGNYDVSYMWEVNRSYLGIGGRWGEPGSKIRFTNLRIRAVNAPAPAPGPAPEAQPGDQ